MDRLGHYRMLDQIGAGGMGEVYRAVDERLGRTVAIKLLHAADATSAAMQLRLLREAQAASALDHPGVVTVFDVGVHESRAYVVMEFVTGEVFSDLAGKLEPVEALRLCAAAADALEAAHDAGILHRDVKSDNLMRTRDGRVKVLDFGLAKLQDGGAAAIATSHPGVAHAVSADISVDQTMRPEDPAISAEVDATLPATSARAADSALTQAGQLIGTPLYMSPEQAEREPVTARSEVYGLGVVLYELLTGTVPFHGDDVPGTLELIRSGALVLPTQRRPSLPRALDPLVGKALARRPEDRFDDMGPFATAMRAVATELDGGGPRKRWPIVVGAGVLAAGGIAAFALTRGGGDGAKPAVVVDGDAAPRAATMHISQPRRLTALDGCEEFPSFADDDHTVVFDGARGKDYVLEAVDVATGAIRQLSDEQGWDWGSSVSPDGKQLAFIRTSSAEAGAWVMDYGGTAPPRKLSRGTVRPWWTADGHLWAGPVTGPRLFDPADGKVLREVTALQGTQYNGVAQLEDGRLAVLINDSAAGLSRGVAFLGDDDQPTLAFPYPADEVLVPVRGGLLTARIRGEKSELWFVPLHGDPSAVVGSDYLEPRKGMAISRAGDMVWSDCETDHELSKLDTASDGKHTWVKIAGGTWEDNDPVQLGTSRSIAVLSNRGGPQQIWILDLDNLAVPRAVTTGNLEPTAPSLSVDGTQLAFAGVTGGIYVAPLDGSAPPRELTSAPNDASPTWLGDEIVYEAWTGKASHVMAVPAAGGTPRELVAGNTPEASRDGKTLLYVDAKTGVPMVRNVATGKAHVLSPDLPPSPFNKLRLRGDGRRAAVLIAQKALVEIEVATGKVLNLVDGGGDQLDGIAYVGDDLIVTRAIWQGDLWIAHGELVLP